MTRRVLLIGATAVLVVAGVWADDVQPVQLQIKELPSGLFDVQWSVPKVIPPEAIPSPRLPESCRPEGESVFVDRSGAWLTRQAFRCPDGLAGQQVGIRHPGFNLALSTLLRVELQTRDRYAHMLYPGDDTWRIPKQVESGLSAVYRRAQAATLGGAAHFFRGPAHLAFLLIVVLLGDLRSCLRLVTAFLAAQVFGVLAASVTGVVVDLSLGEIGVALATVLLARQALLPAEGRTQLTALAVCAGVCHGAGVPGLERAMGPEGGSVTLSALLVVLGMDAALLISVGIVSAIRQALPRRLAGVPWRILATYGAAGFAVAVTIGALASNTSAGTSPTGESAELPRLGTGSSATALPGSRRLASNAPDAAFQSYVSVEAFEIRHEVLVRLSKVADRVGLGSDPVLAVDDQETVKERIRVLVSNLSSLAIDGAVPPPTSSRVDFLSVDDTGALPRPAPVPEDIETAWVGFTTVYLTPTTAREVSVSWDFGGVLVEVPATVTDPESTVSINLDSTSPMLRWINELAEDPVPRVSETAVEPPESVVPVWSLVILAVGLVVAVTAFRHHRPTFSGAVERLLFAVAVVLSPVTNVAVALPAAFAGAPDEAQAARIVARVLPNVYRAFEFREEDAIFDRLSMVVTGDTLTEIYLEHRKVLEMAERGGARARVEAVEVRDVDSIEADDPAGFSARVVWTVGGTVTHFGHRHFRQNRYDATVALVPENDTWKIREIEVFDEQRLR